MGSMTVRRVVPIAVALAIGLLCGVLAEMGSWSGSELYLLTMMLALIGAVTVPVAGSRSSRAVFRRYFAVDREEALPEIRATGSPEDHGARVTMVEHYGPGASVEAIASLIEAANDPGLPNIVLLAGDHLLVKMTPEHGASVVVARRLTVEQRSRLDEHPDWMAQPAKVLGMLGVAARTDTDR
jgi:hypothetical protein